MQQVGTQRDLYERPANAFVAGFVGRTNFLQGRVERPACFAPRAALRSGAVTTRTRGPHAGIASRASVACHDAVAAPTTAFPGTVEFASYLGGMLGYYVRLTADDRLVVQAPNTFADPAYAIGDRIHLHWPGEASLVLSDDGAARVSLETPSGHGGLS